MSLRPAGAFQRRNFALACAAAEAFLGELDPERVAAVAAEIEIPGRLEHVADDPPSFLDAAHNPDAARALAEALPEVAEGRPVVAVLAILADKDAKAMIEALAPSLSQAVCAELSAPRPTFSAAGLSRICAGIGLAVHAEDDFASAIERGRTAALDCGGVLLVTGSHYALGPARAALGLGSE